MRRGLTLVELLVCMVIISVLAAFLLPALSRARASAQMVACQSNLKRQAEALQLYLEDSRGMFLTAGGGPVATYYRWGGKAGTEYSADMRLLNPYVGFEGTASQNEQGVLTVFRCPADRGALASPTGWPNDRLPTVWDCLGYSYMYNCSANGNSWDGLCGKRISSITNSSRVIMSLDWSFSCYFLNWNPFQYSYWHHRSELGWGSVLFVDTHVKYLQATRDNPSYQRGPEWTFVATD